MKNATMQYMQRCIAILKHDEIDVFLNAIQDAIEVIDVELPEGGLFMIKSKDGIMEDQYYLGELSVAKAYIEVTVLSSGETFQGGSVIMSDDEQHARNIAICDALLHENSTYRDDVIKLAEIGQERLEQKARERKQLLEATKVDFSLIEQ